MLYDFHVHDTVRVEYHVSTDGPSFPRGYARIAAETRSAGGNGVVAAVALARWGARVLLTGNAVGADSHGTLVREQLDEIENLTYLPTIEEDIETPYAILLRAGSYDAGALLSPRAAQPELPCRVRDTSIARYFFGDQSAFGGSSESVKLEASSQDYGSLVGTLGGVAAVYLQLTGADWSPSLKAAFTETVTEIYTARFGGLDAIPTLEKIEETLASRTDTPLGDTRLVRESLHI